MIRATSMQELVTAGLDHVSVAFGIFDGFHPGHQKVFRVLFDESAASSTAPVVVTFDPHPRKLVRPDSSSQILFSLEHRLRLFEDTGIAAVVVLPFNESLARLTAEEFIENELLVDGLELHTVCIGSQWRFGHKAHGCTRLLQEMGEKHGFSVCPVEETEDDGGIISSTRIRKALKQGDLETVTALLGRPYSIYGNVAHGKGIATSELHYPTANITAENELFPPCGIYAANAVLRSGRQIQRLPGVMYLGYSPTYIDNAPPTPFVEIHIFDFHEDIYDTLLEVEFLSFIRGDQKFANSDELRRQIGLDVQEALRIHNN